ncbi:odorant receptor 10-like [Prorops nasuta]|uniref:odorant receptor 10-like n=1 Tax=Prorops nasuta TaxID=863751 RepID=UPI0034CDDCF5
MDLFNSPYCKVQKAFLVVCGAWPYYTNNFYLILRILFLIGNVLIMIIPMMVVIFNQFNDFDVTMAVLPLLTGSIMGFSKGIAMYFNSNEVKVLLDEMQESWENLNEDKFELSIIKNYAKRGKQISLAYAFCAYSLLVSYYVLSFVSPTMDLIMPKNESRPRVFIIPGDFFVHEYKNFFTILTIEWYGTMCTGHIILTCDVLYITLMLHSCGMYTVLSKRLEKVKGTNLKYSGDIFHREKLITDQYQNIYVYLSGCIKLHLNIIRFGERMISTFNIAFLTDLGLGVLATSTSAVMFVLSFNKPDQRVRYGMLYIIQSVRIFCNSLPGQLLSDHSSRVNLAAYKGKWHELSRRHKNLLLILMIRSAKPTTFTVGKLFAMDFKLFTKITRTCLSYCTVLLSVKNNDN